MKSFVILFLALALLGCSTSSRLQFDGYGPWLSQPSSSSSRTILTPLYDDRESFLMALLRECSWREASDVPQSDHQFELYKGPSLVGGQLLDKRLYVLPEDDIMRSCEISESQAQHLMSFYGSPVLDRPN